MSQLTHKHTEDCKWSDTFLHYLVEAAPDILWFNVQDVGDYQGSVFGVGLYQKQILIYEDYYGSCSGCGAWGEGGEPTSQEEILEKSQLFTSLEETEKYVNAIGKWANPDKEEMKKAAKEVLQFKK